MIQVQYYHILKKHVKINAQHYVLHLSLRDNIFMYISYFSRFLMLVSKTYSIFKSNGVKDLSATISNEHAYFTYFNNQTSLKDVPVNSLNNISEFKNAIKIGPLFR